MPEVLIRSLVERLTSPTRNSGSTRGSYSNPRMRVKSATIGSVVSPLGAVLGGTGKQATTNPYRELFSLVLPFRTSVAYPRVGVGLAEVSPSLLPKQTFDRPTGNAASVSVGARAVAISVSTGLSE